ncbi:MAG: DUF2147 domain-containing protein [Chitinophagales bacterium]|nr:DUF2147 domain-containing protein [Chitinophagales bacterium]MCZ2394282.1 DUF2147 domain-containing protein [Chitinophagales bacterium]
MKKWLMTLMVVVSTGWAVFASNKDEVLGVWLVQDKDAKIELYMSKEGHLVGKCVWHKIPGLKDIDNKDPKERDKLVVGKIFVWDFVWDNSKGEWVDGKVYKAGKTYCGRIKMNPDGTLFLKGNICGTFLGKTNTWTRVK